MSRKVIHKMITVYSKPGCVQCTATIRALGRADLVFETIDVSADPGTLQRLHTRGYRQVPVIVTDSGEDWSGFRPDRINSLVNEAGIQEHAPGPAVPTQTPDPGGVW